MSGKAALSDPLWVLASVAGRRLAFDGGGIRAIVAAEGITPLPGVADYVLGLVFHRGAIESVLDLSRLLGLSAAAAPQGRILLAAAAGGRAGLLVDEVIDVLPLAVPSQTEDAAPGQILRGPVDMAGGPAEQVDLEALFGRIAGTDIKEGVNQKGMTPRKS